MLTQPDTVTLNIPVRDLESALASVRHAVSTEETRYYLKGVYLHVLEDKLRFVATDGHRMAIADRVLPENAATMPAVIMQDSLVDSIVKACGKRRNLHKIATLQVARAQCAFVGFPGMVGESPAAANIDGSYPDYQRVMPRDVPKQGVATFNREELLHAVLALNGFNKGFWTVGRGSVAVRFAFDGDKAMLSVDLDEGKGSARCDVKAEWEGGTGEKRPDVGFSGFYVADILKAANSSAVTFSFFDSGSPAIWRAVGDLDWQVVLMPVRV